MATRCSPRIHPHDDALSAMVSQSVIFQSVIRESMSSIDGTTHSTAAMTSSFVHPSPGRSLPRMNPTSTSTRGKQSRAVSMGVDS